MTETETETETETKTFLRKSWQYKIVSRRRLRLVWIWSKDAGFVHESFRNKTNRIFWDFWSYEMNPPNESFEHRSTKRIHETNLLNTVGIRESGPQDLYGFVVHLCSKDSWGFVGFMKKGQILSKTVYETNPQNESLNTVDGFVSRIWIRDVRIRISYETNPNWLATNPDSRNESTFLGTSYTISASLWSLSLKQEPR